jgi:hypothetical protein
MRFVPFVTAVRNLTIAPRIPFLAAMLPLSTRDRHETNAHRAGEEFAFELWSTHRDTA